MVEGLRSVVGGVQDAAARGRANRRQGFYAECVIQAIAAAAGLAICREQLEAKDVDFQFIYDRVIGKPRYRRAEVQVKSTSSPRAVNGSFQLRLEAKAYHALNGTVGDQLDMSRYLILVAVPDHFSSYCNVDDEHIALSHLAYWEDLMGRPDLPRGQDTVTVSVPQCNLLTPMALVGLTCGDRAEAARWMSR